MSDIFNIPEDWLIEDNEIQMFNARKKQFKDELIFSFKADEIGLKIIEKTISSKRVPTEQDKVILGLFMRICNSHKAFLREVMFGYWIESECIARPMIDALIYIFEAIDSAEFVRRYFLSQNELREKFVLRSIADNKREVPKLINVNIDLNATLAEIKKEGDGGLKLKDLAIKHKLEFLYEQVYPIYHNSIHVKPNSTGKYFSFEEDQIKVVLRPSTTAPREELMKIVIIHMEEAKKVAFHFGLKELISQIDELWGEVILHSQT